MNAGFVICCEEIRYIYLSRRNIADTWSCQNQSRKEKQKHKRISSEELDAVEDVVFEDSNHKVCHWSV